MPYWLTLIFEVCGGILALAGVAALLHGRVVRPLIRGYEELLKLLAQIRDASSGVQRLAREVEGLAGAIANFVVGIKAQVDHNSERIDALEEMRELVVDHDAKIQRLVRGHRENE